MTDLKDYRRSYKSYNRHKSDWEYSYTPQDAGVSQLYYGDVSHDPDGNYLEIPFTCFSDYAGSTVERSNQRVILDMFKKHIENGIWDCYGGYGTRCVIVSMEFYNNNEELQQLVEDLFDYPVVDEDDMSNLEFEIEEEDWDSWRRHDLIGLLEKNDLEYDEETLSEHLYDAMEKAQEYVIFEDAVSSWIDLEKVIKYW